ncbi:MAG: glycosyltransferase family 2 protein [Candidatus Omnitrophica bacterium]|nr:glycosyltransferase family 2 protein [Candidatus Omnitrophota bacterium]
MNPLVSVIIVNHNGIDFVDTCLSSVLNSSYTDFEVVFVDNASGDGSLEYVKKAFGSDQRLKFVENSGSLGPAVGRNRGSRSAKGKYLIFLDNDTKVKADWISELVEALEYDKTIGAAQAKLLRMDTDFYDCAGDYLGPLGFLIERSRCAKDTGQFDYIADILSAKSAASIIRKDLFDKIGGFDEDFYMYLEETDLSWRVWLAGYRVVFVPKAVVYHSFETAKKDIKKYYSKYVVRYYGCRNYISTLIKNLEFRNLIRFLPLHIFSWVILSLLFLLKGQLRDFFYIIKGIFWNMLNFGLLLKKRRTINREIRARGDTSILKTIKSSEGIGDYLRKITSYLSAGLA